MVSYDGEPFSCSHLSGDIQSIFYSTTDIWSRIVVGLVAAFTPAKKNLLELSLLSFNNYKKKMTSAAYLSIWLFCITVITMTPAAIKTLAL